MTTTLDERIQETVDKMDANDKANMLAGLLAIGAEQLPDGRYAATEAQLICFISLCVGEGLKQAGVEL